MSDDPNFNNLLPLPWMERFQPAIPDEHFFHHDSWWIAHSASANGALLFQQVTEVENDTPATVEARARLWAAAPDLVDAAYDALVCLIAWDSDNLEALQRAHDKLRKAFLKATGRDVLAEETGENYPIPWHCSDCGATWEASLAEFPDKAYCPQCESVHIY